MLFNEEINIVIAGEAGQGIETAAEVITKILHLHNFYVFSTAEYMSRIRGGCNSSLIKVGREKSPCFSKRIDLLFALDSKAFEHLKERISENTISLDLKKKNFFVVGYVFASFRLDLEKCLELLKTNFEKYNQEKNINDLKEGFFDGEKNIDFRIEITQNNKDNMLISVNDALGLGCISGGCNFLPFYPMSPATFLQQFLTSHADEFGLVSKQVEDEICVINMALGAWYAGARAIACTSGGGFDLMCEGLSLAGMSESPIVLNIAMRPGPATGLPTRTEQGDLNLAFYAGHGEFPRIIYAPATIEDAFRIGQISLDIADKFQVPVFILTDQNLLDSTYSVEKFTPVVNSEKYIIKSNPDYKRYKLSESAISPRAIPCFGEGIVCIDSDEHDENGWLTEDFEVRKTMVQKRLRKLEPIQADTIKEQNEPFGQDPKSASPHTHPHFYPFYFVGGEFYKTLIVSWGSNFETIKEAIKGKSEFALLHFTQVYPINKLIFSYTKKAERVVIIEQNATGEFEKLLRHKLGITFNEKLLKFNGEAFCVEEIKKFLEKINDI